MNLKSTMRRYIGQLSWFFVLLAALVVSILTSWFAISGLDYGFPFWYEFYNIGPHVDHFGPQNRYVSGLELLPASEHIRLFSEIVYSVHHHGVGLEDIRFIYQGENQAMLRNAEVIHLQDVANLIDNLRNLLYTSTAILVAGMPVLVWRRSNPDVKIQGLLLSFLIGAISAWVFVVGAKEAFYQIHVWIFPPDHDWFFYYQDSLMSTLMKAPYLFGGIAIAIIAGATVLFGGILLLIRARFRLLALTARG